MNASGSTPATAAQVTCFPSLVESAPPMVGGVARSLAEGILLHDRGQRLLVGDLALREGRAAQRIINAHPESRDYRALLRAALVVGVAGASSSRPLTIASGFPTATMNAYAPVAQRTIGELDAIEYDTTPSGGSGVLAYAPVVSDVHITSEIAACDAALRLGPQRAQEPHFILSLGYGTTEGALFLPTGIIQRSAFSVAGMRYAVEQAMLELGRTHNLGLRTEHQFDMHFRTGKITIGRERMSLAGIRARAIRSYFENILLPAVANTWTSDDFGRADKLFVTGGGALYVPLIELLRDEFGASVQMTVAPEPLAVASLGYALLARKVAKPGTTAIGIDIGNANTCVTVLSA